MLISYFEGIADIEYNTAKEMNKLGGVIQVPFRELPLIHISEPTRQEAISYAVFCLKKKKKKKRPRPSLAAHPTRPVH